MATAVIKPISLIGVQCKSYMSGQVTDVTVIKTSSNVWANSSGGDPSTDTRIIFLFDPADVSQLKQKKIIKITFNIYIANTGFVNLQLTDTKGVKITNSSTTSQIGTALYGSNYIRLDFFISGNILEPKYITLPPQTNFQKIISDMENGLCLTPVYGTKNHCTIALFNSADFPYIEVEYYDSNTPGACSIVQPKQEILNGEKECLFSWKFSQPADDTQSHYEIETQPIGGEWSKKVEKTPSAEFLHRFPPNSFLPGNYRWRVKCYNNEGRTESEWSEPAAFFLLSSSDPPSGLACTNTPRPDITWKSEDQQAFQIRAITKNGEIYHSGVRFGKEKQFKIPVFLPDGEITFYVSIQNQYGLWSKESQVTTTIQNQPGQVPMLSASSLLGGVRLSWEEGCPAAYIMRDGVLIAKTQENNYIDWLTAKTHSYTVRAVSGDYYTDSLPIQAAPSMPYDLLAPLPVLRSEDWIPLRLVTGGLLTRNYERSTETAYFWMSGKPLPIALASGRETRRGSFSFTLDPGSASRLEALVGHTVICKDRRGNKVGGILESVNLEVGNCCEASFVITEIDLREGLQDE